MGILKIKGISLFYHTNVMFGIVLNCKKRKKQINNLQFEVDLHSLFKPAFSFEEYKHTNCDCSHNA